MRLHPETVCKEIHRHRVWDLPTRSFHWLFAGSFVVAFFTRGDSRYLDVHLFAGYLFGGLILFRLLWGLVGSRHARFRDFAFGWRVVRAYLLLLLRGVRTNYTGHNPAGAWAIFLMLALGAGVALTGLLVVGGQEGYGPIAALVSRPVGVALHPLHEALSWTMLAVAGMHVAGVLVESLLHGENLAAAMINGSRRIKGESVPRFFGVGAALPLIAAVLAFVSFKGYLFETPGQPYRPFVAQALPQNELWRSECGDCHLPYHPSLLPRRSWAALFAKQNDHFGESLDLDAQTVAALMQFAERYSAESGLTEAAWFIDTTTPAEQTAVQITRTPYWKRQHHRIPERFWKARQTGNGANCEACHLDAKEGTFEDSAMHLPNLADKVASAR